MPDEAEATTTNDSAPDAGGAAAPESGSDVAPVQSAADVAAPAQADTSAPVKTDEVTPVVDEALADRAANLGLTAADIEKFGDGLEAELRRREVQIDREMLSRFGPKEAPAQKPAGEKPAAVGAKLAPQVSTDGVFAATEDGSLVFAPEFLGQFDELAGKAFKGLEKVLNEQRQQIRELSGDFGEVRNQRMFEQFDHDVAQLPPELRSEFGDGSTNLMKDGPAKQARFKLLENCHAVASAYRQQGKNLAPEEIVRKAANILLEDKIKQSERQKIVDQLKKRSQAIQPRATNRKPSTPAVAGKKPGSYEEFDANPKVQEILKKFGVSDEEGEVELPDFKEAKK